MKLKQLESALSVVEPFRAPKFELEQYPTSAHLASRMVFAAEGTYGDLDGRAVLDLGTGTGMLALAAEHMSSAYTLGVDLDPDALVVAVDNRDHLEAEADFIRADILDGTLPLAPKSFDTVLMNPPFGTRCKGADVAFLEAGMCAARSAVYSMHKSSTRDFLQRKAQKEWGVEFEVVAQLRFDIKKMYKFHKKQSADVNVDLIRIGLPEEQAEELGETGEEQQQGIKKEEQGEEQQS